MRDADLLANLLQCGVHTFVDISDSVHSGRQRYIPLLEDRKDIVHVRFIPVLLNQADGFVGEDHPCPVRIFGSLELNSVAFDPTPFHMANIDPGHSGSIIAEEEQVETKFFPFVQRLF